MFSMFLVIAKILVLCALPVDILFRSKIAIEKYGLEHYRNMPGRDLFKKVSWRDAKSLGFGLTLLFIDIFIVFSLLSIAVSVLVK